MPRTHSFSLNCTQEASCRLTFGSPDCAMPKFTSHQLNGISSMLQSMVGVGSRVGIAVGSGVAIGVGVCVTVTVCKTSLTEWLQAENKTARASQAVENVLPIDIRSN